MKRMIEIIFIIFISLPVITKAGILVYVDASAEMPADKIIENFEKPIFYEERFVLIHQQYEWNTDNFKYQVLSRWDNSNIGKINNMKLLITNSAYCFL